MENKKRARFERININNNDSNEDLLGVASSTIPMGSATLATIGGQSFILSNSINSPLPADLLLSICDENSDMSGEFILDHGTLTPIKQEHTVATQTTNNLVTTTPQYRIINQSGKPLNTSSSNSVVVNSNSSLISNSLNLPPGCEIYVIKEVFDPPKQNIFAESTTITDNSPKAISDNSTTIELDPLSTLPVQRNYTLNGNKTKNLNSNNIIGINTPSPVTSTSNISSANSDDNLKTSLILEAYKKRDDKRRATHNEVERRRRDKINSWIFKLKEMLPSEVKNCNTTNNQNNIASNLLAQQLGTATSTRTNDSKSQILIRACEYIKSMKEEMSSLRECLTENENLRVQNQHLQEEINNLRNKQQQQQKLHNNNNILLTTNTTHRNNNNVSNSENSDSCEITLNSLNATYANVQLFTPPTNDRNNHHHLADLVGLTTNSNTTSIPNSVNVSYGKRKLIITDYVD